jgi:demethylmenaquinone methyltransferase/2-methoxy-6-polyprenyl-1,4-benzoquinol methylase
VTDRSNVREQIDHYARQAAGYDRSIWTLGRRDNRNHLVKITKLARALRVEQGGHVLEVGTGTGVHGAWIVENCPVEYTGVDASVEMLKIARDRMEANAARVRLAVVDAHGMPFADGSFDATFCSGTLHHLNDPARGIAEMARVTKPGGRVAAMEPNWKFPSTLLIATFTPAERNAFKLNARRLAEWARAAGLRDVAVERVLFTPPKPEKWGARFDRIDARLANMPVLKRASIMLLVTGTK